MPHAPLPRSLPEDQGVDSDGLLAFLDAMDAAPDVELHGLVVIRNGHQVAEGWWSPYGPDQPQLLYSLSKSFTSTAAAFAAAEGLLDLDATVLSYFPELDSAVTDPRSRSMLVRHVAAMASGHRAETIEEITRRAPQDPVLSFLQIPPDDEPGTVFAYNQPCTYTLGAIIQRGSGQTLSAYLRDRLFDPLGIGEVGWLGDWMGREYGFSGFHATTSAIARLGLLYLQRGEWEGRQLISADWVDEATRTQVANPDEEEIDWRQGYGFQFWMARHGYRGDGAYGQYCIVLPEHNTVVAITSSTLRMQTVLDGLWEHLLPALHDEPRPSSYAATELAARLGAATLPPVVYAGERPADLGTDAYRLTPRSSDVATLTGVELTVGADAVRLQLFEGPEAVGAEVGLGRWLSNPAALDHGRSGVPIAASGSWSDARTFVAELIFLHTPHRLRITADLAAGVVDAHWPTVPLHPVRLSEFRMPRPVDPSTDTAAATASETATAR